MLNLLFISDSPKVKYVKSVLKPVLKVIIDIVTDFDQGLKEVVGKRPSIICIQDQIGGVTAESVARHIQMLLGNRAPAIILLHTGNGQAQPIKGLYEHLIDLSQSNEMVAEEIKSTFKSLLGDQWEKIYIPLETSRGSEKVPGTVESDRAQSINDDLAEMLLVDENKRSRDESSAAVPPVVATSPASNETFPGRTLLAKAAVSTPGIIDTMTTSAPVAAPPAPSAAEFLIRKDTPPVGKTVPEELLLTFEENYRSESLLVRRRIVFALVCIVCVAGGWYFIKQKPQLVSTVKHRIMPSPGTKQVPVTVPPAVPVPSLPAFIPKEGHDSSYAIKNPGWERYVGKLEEFRIFSTSGRIQAVQVLALKDAPISESLLTSVLKEYAGSPEYLITSRSTQTGVRVEKGRIQSKGEVIIYRKNGVVKAFVVSVN